MIVYHDDLRFHADEWTPLHALHSSQKGTINLETFFYARCQLVERAELLKVAFFQKVRFVFQISQSQKQIFPKTILNLKLKFPAKNTSLLLA